jgi:hypothetical protein
MGRKKQINGSTISIDLPPPPPPPVPEPKKKRELSDKQRENLSKGMAILKAKRESKSKKDDVDSIRCAEQSSALGSASLIRRFTPSEVEEAPAPAPAPPAPAPAPAPPAPAPEPAPVVKKERKPRIVKNYLTTEDFNSFKSELLTSLKPSAVQQPVLQALPAIREPAIKEPAIRERVISGSELLNRIFFKQ